MFPKKSLLIIIPLIFLTSCSVAPVTPTVSLPVFITATLPATATPAPTSTPLPPTIAPTVAPIPGRTTTQVNLRQDTSTASPSLGTIPAFTNVQITGKDVSGLWVQVIFNGQTGWVRAEYVQAEDASAQIPVLGAESGGGSNNRGVVLRGVNVRSGPGTNFDSLGLLNQNDVVPISGKDPSGGWYQVQYAGVEGWIAAEFLQVDNAEAVPVVNAAPLATQTVEVGTQSLPAFRTAQPDGDSAGAPLAVFRIGENIQTTLFQGEVSSPGGDVEDWVGFKSNSKQVAISILCNLGVVQVELMQPDGRLDMLLNGCSQSKPIQVQPGQVYLLRISPLPPNEPAFINYEVRMEIIVR